jgi:hypothetical protein
MPFCNLQNSSYQTNPHPLAPTARSWEWLFLCNMQMHSVWGKITENCLWIACHYVLPSVLPILYLSCTKRYIYHVFKLQNKIMYRPVGKSNNSQNIHTVSISPIKNITYDIMKYQNNHTLMLSTLKCLTSFCFCCVNWLYFSSEACNFLLRSPTSSSNCFTSAVKAATKFSEPVNFWVRSVKQWENYTYGLLRAKYN